MTCGASAGMLASVPAHFRTLTGEGGGQALTTEAVRALAAGKTHHLDGEPYVTAMLDFGPASVDGWFAKLVAAELGIATSGLLDVGARELVVGSRRSALTRREFDTLHYLVQRSGNAVHREEILSDVWGDAADVSSNVVDVVVRSLRKKLAERADVIETISGFGYRLCDGDATND